MSRQQQVLPYELAALVLVAVYINTIEIWRFLVTHLGASLANAVPLVLTALTAAGIVALILRCLRLRRPVRASILTTAGVLVLAALLLSDPAFPAKRIHVPQYILMAFVVRQALMHHFRGTALVVATTMVTAILGSHDELIQGLYPERSFGLRDVAVNAVSGFSGALVSFGFEGSDDRRGGSPPTGGIAAMLETRGWISLVALGLGWIALLVSIPPFRGASLPFWTLLPLAGGCVVWATLVRAGTHQPAQRYLLSRACVLMMATAVYPLMTHATPLVFQ